MTVNDRALGMGRSISRRDFLNGFALGAGATLVSNDGWAEAMAATLQSAQLPIDGAYYPPALQGLRGSHPGSFESAHRVRDGESLGTPEDTGESYDLVVVGGGISGLSAAHFYRESAGGEARILVLDNHDDFGGHAKRNEFTHEGRMFIGYGGTQSIDTPASFSPQATALLKDLSIDLDRFYSAFDRELYRSLSLSRGAFFDKETFGEDRLVAGMGGREWSEFVAETPLSTKAKKDLIRLTEENVDPWPELDEKAKKAKLAATSYLGFLQALQLDPAVMKFMQSRTHGLFGMGIDGVPALDLWGLGYPGFDAMELTAGKAPGMSATAIPKQAQQPYIFHFPDGNASIARLLVRKLIPGAADGSTMEDIVTARLRYQALDRKESRTRIRLNSTVVHVAHRRAGASESGLDVTYIEGSSVRRIFAERVVLACYHSVIPYLCPELPEPQKKAMTYSPKVPLVYTNVLIRNWTAFEKLGVSNIYFPNSFHAGVSLDFPVSLGTYRHPKRTDEPMVLHLTKTPCLPGGSATEQHAAGRYALLATDYETFERETRAQLGRALSGGGFDPARDILGITVNRWPHGYTYEYNSLWDPAFAPGEAPHEIARSSHGGIHIANSDSAAYAYTQAAIDEAHRAVSEIVGTIPETQGASRSLGD